MDRLVLNGIRAIAFDLDGTLVDSAPDICHALNTGLAEAGLAPAGLAHGAVHDGIADLIEGLHGRYPLVVVTNKPTRLACAAAGCPMALVGWGYGAHAPPGGTPPWHVGTPRLLLRELASRCAGRS